MNIRVFALATMLAACGDDSGTLPDSALPIDGPPIDQPTTTDVPRVEAAQCRYDVPSSLGLTEGQGYSCGDLVVYENRETKARTIKVHFVKFDSASASPNATVYLDGGPGGDGQNIVSYTGFLGPAYFDGLRSDGDFLVIGQRGTSVSMPFLDCQSEQQCSQYDLAAYNTAANADDVDDLRAVLGYTKLNVYGISYGSRLGLEVLRRHGANVRSAFIEGLVPSQIAWPAAVPASFYSALTHLNESCADAGACGTTYGNLTTKFSTAVSSLNNAPLTVMVQGSPFDLDGYTLAYVMFQTMYSKSAYAYLPLIINDLAQRRTDRIEPYLDALLGFGGGGGGGVSQGLYYSVVCGEIFNPPDEAAFDQLNAGVPADIVEMFGGNWFGLMQACKEWPRHNLQAQLAQPVTSAVRTFVSSGDLDPITPPGFGAIAAQTLSNSIVVDHANSGHGASLQSACGVANLVNFIASPDGPQDTSCAATITTDYVLPSAFTSRPFPGARIRAEMSLTHTPPFVGTIARAKLAAHAALVAARSR